MKAPQWRFCFLASLRIADLVSKRRADPSGLHKPCSIIRPPGMSSPITVAVDVQSLSVGDWQVGQAGYEPASNHSSNDWNVQSGLLHAISINRLVIVRSFVDLSHGVPLWSLDVIQVRDGIISYAITWDSIERSST